MTLEAGLEGAFDYIVAATKTAWPGTTVSHEPTELANQDNFALISLVDLTFSPQTKVTDQCVATFAIVGQWPKSGAITGAMITKTGLRTELLSDHTAGGVGNLGMVPAIPFDQGQVLDGKYQVKVLYSITLSVER